MSQPIVPVLLYFFDWLTVLLSLVLLNYFWRFAIVPRFLSVNLADIGPFFFRLKFSVCPIMALLIWQRGSCGVALLALLWPLIVPSFVHR